ncbi:potassium channel family protein [Jatrophihabitans sp.]|jgi:voltage-gated potassium channel|uniref:potassium channel family protein n=1 Tax=Jatrophihabitans sp. TaxID=1932789 RepID=UPI002F062BD0
MTSSSSTDRRVTRWESATEWPLTVTAVLFLIAYAWPILDPDLHHSAKAVFKTVTVLAWGIFIADYAVRLALAQRRFHYWSHHLLDLAVIALPLLRPLRLLRLVMLLRVVNRTATISLRGRIAAYVAGGTALLLFCGALAVLDAERGHPGANIVNFGDAAWWAVTTVSTVGYGDRYPVTTEGRAVALGLMLGGVALLGVVTASIASWLIDRVQEAEEMAESATRADVAALVAKVDELHRVLIELQRAER